MELFILLLIVFITSSYSFLSTNVRYYSLFNQRIRKSSSFVEMNIADRFFRVVKSNVNNLLSNMEDPEKVLDQAMDDMQKDLVKIRQSYAEISATQKRAEKKREQAEKMSEDWYKRAQLALEAGDEELAREALSRRQIQLESIDSLTKQIDTQNVATDKLYTSMSELDQKIQDAKRQKDEYIARARTAKTATQVNDMLSSVSGTTSMDAFDRMREKVENMEAEAEVAGELAASSTGSAPKNLEDRFKALEGDNRVDDELEALKKQLPGSPKEVAQLPSTSAASPSVPASQTDDALDAEYEKLKKELGK